MGKQKSPEPTLVTLKQRSESSGSSSESGSEEEYVVEAIFKRRVGVDGDFDYLLKWEGYDGTAEQETWEPLENVTCFEMLKEFDRLEGKQAVWRKEVESKKPAPKEKRQPINLTSSDDEEDAPLPASKKGKEKAPRISPARQRTKPAPKESGSASRKKKGKAGVSDSDEDPTDKRAAQRAASGPLAKKRPRESELPSVAKRKAQNAVFNKGLSNSVGSSKTPASRPAPTATTPSTSSAFASPRPKSAAPPAEPELASKSRSIPIKVISRPAPVISARAALAARNAKVVTAPPPKVASTPKPFSTAAAVPPDTAPVKKPLSMPERSTRSTGLLRHIGNIACARLVGVDSHLACTFRGKSCALVSSATPKKDDHAGEISALGSLLLAVGGKTPTQAEEIDAVFIHRGATLDETGLVAQQLVMLVNRDIYVQIFAFGSGEPIKPIFVLGFCIVPTLASLLQSEQLAEFLSKLGYFPSSAFALHPATAILGQRVLPPQTFRNITELVDKKLIPASDLPPASEYTRSLKQDILSVAEPAATFPSLDPEEELREIERYLLHTRVAHPERYRRYVVLSDRVGTEAEADLNAVGIEMMTWETLKTTMEAAVY